MDKVISSYLGIDIAPQRTQAWLFDDHLGKYELLASGNSQTSSTKGLMEGLAGAVGQLEQKTNRLLWSRPGRFLIESEQTQSGLKGVGITLSIGKPIRVVLVGISEKYSLEPLRRLVRFYNTEIVLEICLQNEPNFSAQLEKLTNTAFDLLVITGGVDGGPERSLRAMIGNIRLLVQLRGVSNRPQIVFAGNNALADYARSEIDAGEDLHLARNIQPESGREDLSLAATALMNAVCRLRLKEFPELQGLQGQSRVKLLPGEFARSRINQFLEQTQTNEKGVLQVHLEPDYAHAIAIRNNRRMGVWQNNHIDERIVTEILEQSDQPLDRGITAAYISNRIINPGYAADTIEEMSMELSWLCVRVRRLLVQMAELYSEFKYDPPIGLQDDYEPIMLSGNCFERLPSARHSFIVAQDGILPHGITTLVGDDHNLLTSLGVLAEFDALLPVQIIDSDLFSGLATVINVDSSVTVEKKVLELEVDEGYDSLRDHYQVYKGELKRFETIPGNDLRVYLAPEPESDVGMGLRGLGGWLSAGPTRLGLVVDARGRPCYLPADDFARQELRRDWIWNLGAW